VLNLKNGCCHLAEELLCSSLLSNNIKTEIPKHIILPLFCNGIEVVCPTLRQEHGLRDVY